MNTSYVELLAKSNFSFLRGASHPGEFVAQAAKWGMPAVGIADWDGVYGLPKAFLATRQWPTVRLISGAELTLAAHPSLVFLCVDRAGYGLLCHLLTESKQGEASLPWEQFLALLETHPGERQGLLVIPRPGENTRYGVLKELFPQRVFLPLSRFLDGHDDERSAQVLQLHKQFGLPILATNDAHYHIPERRMVQDILTAVREKTPLSQLGYRLFSNGERYLKSSEEMTRLFADMPEALQQTLAIAERCEFSLSELRYQYPSEWLPAGVTAQEFLERLVWEGAQKRYAGPAPADVAQQLRHELRLIEELSFADYFLTLWEIVAFARSRDILCQGRGSAANSAVCFCLEITAVDPVRMNLLFERFLSAERGEPPDIDVDFEHERREEVIQHIYERYGRARAAMVAAVITYRKRSAIRDVCRALDVEYETFAAAPKDSPLQQKIRTLAATLRDFPRHLSIHSGGFVLSHEALSQICPVEPARMPGRTIIQWDKYDLDALNLVKVDVLSLGILTAIKKTLTYIGKDSLAAIPAEDPATYQMIDCGDTVGVFQIESRAQINMCQRLLPKTYYDLVVQVALVRPGPIVGKMVHPYLRRRRGLEDPTVPDPRLKPILDKTLGVPIFQEQVMKMAITLAGFSPGEADQLRRAIGAWRSSGSIERVGRKLMDGLLREGLPQAYVERIFEQIKGFAEYGFPESHAASFALLAYASAYLKCHYPAAFACALVNSQPLGFYAVHTLIDEAKRHEVCVLPVCPNHSQWDCTLEGGALRLGFRVVRHLSQQEGEGIVAARQARMFVSLFDFLHRTRLRRHIVEQLAMGNAFAVFGLTERQALWETLRFFPGSVFATLSDTSATVDWQALQKSEMVSYDYASYGVSLRHHPMAMVREKFRASYPQIFARTSKDLKTLLHGQAAEAVGMVIVRQRPATAGGTVFATLEDEDGFFDLMVPQKIVEKYEEVFLGHAFLIAKGRIQRDAGAVSLLVREVLPIQRTSHEPQETPREPPLAIRAREWH